MKRFNQIKLKGSELPKKMAELMHSNQFLKIFSLSAMALVLMVLVMILVIATKEPMVITLNSNGAVVEKTGLPKVEDQIREGIKHYLEKRYQWEPEDVIKKLKASEEFITPKALKAFQAAVTNVARFSTEKIVSQRIYPNKIDIDLKKQTALITGDRVTTIQGLKAAGNLKLELTFENGTRTQENPWGIYISKEREE
jgi:type IV secretory pathway component VirB8